METWCLLARGVRFPWKPQFVRAEGALQSILAELPVLVPAFEHPRVGTSESTEKGRAERVLAGRLPACAAFSGMASGCACPTMSAR